MDSNAKRIFFHGFQTYYESEFVPFHSLSVPEINFIMLINQKKKSFSKLLHKIK